MRRIRYQVACSLDGFIASPDGSYDWIPADPDIDFPALLEQFDTLLMGRRTYEVLQAGGFTYPGQQMVVLSRTLDPRQHPDVTVLAENAVEEVRAMRQGAGKDIWLFGGGEVFRLLLEQGLVDTVEPALVPVLLGSGIRLLPETSVRARLRYRTQTLYPRSGILLLEYDVAR